MTLKGGKKKAVSLNAFKLFRKLFFFGLLFILLLNTYLVWSLQKVVSRVDKYNQGVVDEIGLMNGDLRLFAQDLNEIRRFLLLPERDYGSLGQSEDQKVGAVDESKKDNVAIFAMLDALSEEKKYGELNQKAAIILKDLTTNEEFNQILAESSLQIGEVNDLNIKFNDISNSVFKGQPLFNLGFNPAIDQFVIQSILGDFKIKDYRQDKEFSTLISTYFKDNVSKVIDQKNEEQKKAELEIKKAEESIIQEVEDRRLNFESIIKDPAFLDTLKESGWKLSEKSKEESNKYYYDILDSETNQLAFSIGVELSSGMIKITRDGKESNVRSFLEVQNPKKKL